MTARASDLLATLKSRFERNMSRHPGVAWADVQSKIEGNARAMKALAAMEASGGEPDVIGRADAQGGITFCDCAAETPAGRRSLCYDREALDGRKENKPQSSVLDMAAHMGIALLNEDQYRALQSLGEFDTRTSSWILTPPEVRDLGGALFGDRRYGRVFIYHNGAASYYAARAFRGALTV